MSLEKLKKTLQELIDRLKEAKHKEADTETKFIEPLMIALGWNMTSEDVSKREQLGENFPDYTFKINGARKFILEAKKIGLSLDGKYQNKTFVEQAIDYAKRSDCTWAVLTNFNEFRVYSTDKKDNNGLVFKIEYNEYTEDESLEILTHFSRENMAKNELTHIGEKYGFKIQKVSIDKILLTDLLHFREILSKDIIKNNQHLKSNIELCDDIIQKLLDRLIFIRNCEDRDIENDKLIALVNTKGILRKLRLAFLDKNKYGFYNSSLFAEHECDRVNIVLTDETLSIIIAGLYESQKSNLKYNFAEIESDVLGSIYEQYLSHLLNKRKKGSLGENLAKKKQQGIYYTPTYIVDYIVKNTLGKVFKGKTNLQIEKIKVLDMACGSGSFLIKCFDVFQQGLLGEYRNEKTIKPKEQLALSMLTEKIKSLSPIKKCEIIKKNIYGVDLDKQAVEISQLNLVLKIKNKIRLPLTNIKCGDSLLDGENSKINIGLFEEFNVKSQKFDVIVGNPPYVDIKELDNTLVKKLFSHYSTVENRMNLYSVFVEKAMELLRNGGYFGFIIPNSILVNESYSKIRKLLLTNVCLEEIIRLPDNIFEGVKVETIILILKKDKAKIATQNCKVLIYKADEKISGITEKNANSVSFFKQVDWQKENKINLNLDKDTKKIIAAIEVETKPLEYYCDFTLGITPYDKYQGQSKEDIENKIYHSDIAKTKFYKPLLSGENITRYGVNWNGGKYIKYGSWLAAPRELRFFTKPRIVVRQIISGYPASIYAGYTDKELYNTQIAFNILVKDNFKKDIKIKYLLAILNSNLMTYYHRENFLDPTKKLFQKILIANARKLPIKSASKQTQTKIETLVDSMIALKTKLYKLEVKTEVRTKLENQILVIDNKINNEIFKIYGIKNLSTI